MDWEEIIEDCLLATILEFCEHKSEIMSAVFLTGSYIRKAFNRAKPNVNVYFVSAPGCAESLRVELSHVWTKVRECVRSRGAEFTVDCHPYTVSYRDLEYLKSPLLTLTTKVFEGSRSSSRFDLPPTIGPGWLLSYRVIWGDESQMDYFKSHLEPNLEWIQTIHEALCRYGNILQHLLWALPWEEYPLLLAEESVRYAEEAVKDCVAIALTPKDFSDGTQFNVLFNWKQLATEFFDDRCGEEVSKLVQQIARLKQLQLNVTISSEEAIEVWLEANSIWNVVWKEFSRRVTRDFPEHSAWLGRVNAFV